MAPNMNQERQMRWILFIVFVVLFVIIVLSTLIVIFFGGGDLKDNERSTLFNVFLVEIGLAVVALFYTIFNLRRRGEIQDMRVRLDPGKYGDPKSFIGKTATLSIIDKDYNILNDTQVTILKDITPYIPLNLPPNAYSVSVRVNIDGVFFSGSFTVGTLIIEVIEE